MAMKAIPTPHTSACTPRVAAGLLVLWMCWGCQLGEADVVRRTPEPSGAGGSVERDAQPLDKNTMDAAFPDAPMLDLGSPVDAPDHRDARAEIGVSSDAAVDKNLQGYDGSAAFREAGDRGEVSAPPCGALGDVFCDDFGGSEDPWVVMGGGGWTVVAEAIDGSEPNLVFGPTNPGPSIASVPSGDWHDMTVEAKVLVTSFRSASATNRVVLYARFQDVTHFYGVALRGDGKLDLRRNANVFGSVASVTVAVNEWHTMKIRVSGPADNVLVEGFLDDDLLLTATDTNGSLPSDEGTIGVGVYGGALAIFDDVRVSSP